MLKRLQTTHLLHLNLLNVQTSEELLVDCPIPRLTTRQAARCERSSDPKLEIASCS